MRKRATATDVGACDGKGASRCGAEQIDGARVSRAATVWLNPPVSSVAPLATVCAEPALKVLAAPALRVPAAMRGEAAVGVGSAERGGAGTGLGQRAAAADHARQCERVPSGSRPGQRRC